MAIVRPLEFKTLRLDSETGFLTNTAPERDLDWMVEGWDYSLIGHSDVGVPC